MSSGLFAFVHLSFSIGETKMPATCGLFPPLLSRHRVHPGGLTDFAPLWLSCLTFTGLAQNPFDHRGRLGGGKVICSLIKSCMYHAIT